MLENIIWSHHQSYQARNDGLNQKADKSQNNNGALKRLQPQNETLKASIRRRTAVGVNSLSRAVRKLLNGLRLIQETGSVVPSDASLSWVGMHSRVLS